MALWAIFGVGPIELLMLLIVAGVFLGSVAGAGVFIYLLWKKSSRKDDSSDRQPPRRD